MLLATDAAQKFIVKKDDSNYRKWWRQTHRPCLRWGKLYRNVITPQGHIGKIEIKTDEKVLDEGKKGQFTPSFSPMLKACIINMRWRTDERGVNRHRSTKEGIPPQKGSSSIRSLWPSFSLLLIECPAYMMGFDAIKVKKKENAASPLLQQNVSYCDLSLSITDQNEINFCLLLLANAV